jgi:catalase-peroxidase
MGNDFKYAEEFRDTITSGLEGAWTNEPTKWDNGFLDNLYKYDWYVKKSPAGATQWAPTDPAAASTVPDAHDPSKRHAPMMLTTDLSMRQSPIYAAISKRFHEHPEELNEAFAKAWYKLLHPGQGPVSRYLGPWVPPPQLWQDPVPAVDHELTGEKDIADLKGKLLASGLSITQLVSTAWASAASFRSTDKRGGANGARIRLAPQKNWEVNKCGRTGKGAAKRSSRTSTACNPAGRRYHSPISSSWAGARLSSRRPRTPGTISRCRSRRVARTPRRNRPTRGV